MITWMPQIEPGATAQSLADTQLFEQIVDAEGLLRLLEGRSTDSEHHEWYATQMWTGYEYFLCVHGLMMASELISVRERDTPPELIAYLSKAGAELEEMPGIELGRPPWMGDLDVHRSHRSNLMLRWPNTYAESWTGVPPKMPVLWPQLADRDPRGYRLRINTSDLRKLRHGTRSLPPWLRFDESRQEVVAA